ncbi:MAG: hypothetical protein VYB50_05705 [Candidatus Thermoplasmatota archaeon]|nr:hypothetical protein [Candidatus Thermoplasmatota archaeon]
MMEASEIEQMKWYPSGIATGLLPKESEFSGFNKFRLSTRWGTSDMYLPESNPKDENWWRMLTSSSEWWGEKIDLSNSKIEQIDLDGLEWKVVTFAGEVFEIYSIPLDVAGNSRTLSEIDCTNLLSPIGGLQYNGKDVLIVTPAAKGKSSVEVMSQMIESSDVDGLNKLGKRIGETLGNFSSSVGKDNHSPNVQRKWNNHLKKIEDCTKTNTLWRAPHSPETEGTITHGNLSLENIFVGSNSIEISCRPDYKVAAIPRSTENNPSIRDLATIFVSLNSHLTNLKGLEFEEGMRKEIIQAWSSKAPKRWSSQRAFDTHRGGVTIWEYENHLVLLAKSQALGEKVPGPTKDWLAKVSRLQASMFANRTWSAMSLLCWGSSAIIAVLWLNEGVSNIDGLAAIPLALIGFKLRKIYNSRARPPWIPL